MFHDGSGIQRRIKTAAGCYCCFHLLRYFLHYRRVHWCPGRRGGGGSRGECRDGSCDGGWCHGRCWHGGAELETMRWMKGRWRRRLPAPESSRCGCRWPRVAWRCPCSLPCCCSGRSPSSPHLSCPSPPSLDRGQGSVVI